MLALSPRKHASGLQGADEEDVTGTESEAMLAAAKRQHGCRNPKRLHRATFVGGIRVGSDSERVTRRAGVQAPGFQGTRGCNPLSSRASIPQASRDLPCARKTRFGKAAMAAPFVYARIWVRLRAGVQGARSGLRASGNSRSSTYTWRVPSCVESMHTFFPSRPQRGCRSHRHSP